MVSPDSRSESCRYCRIPAVQRKSDYIRLSREDARDEDVGAVADQAREKADIFAREEFCLDEGSGNAGGTEREDSLVFRLPRWPKLFYIRLHLDAFSP